MQPRSRLVVAVDLLRNLQQGITKAAARRWRAGMVEADERVRWYGGGAIWSSGRCDGMCLLSARSGFLVDVNGHSDNRGLISVGTLL